MKYLGLMLFWTLGCYAAIRSEQQHIELTTNTGCEILITYSTELYQSSEAKGVDLHVEEIFINAEDCEVKSELAALFNHHKVKIDCKERFCHKKVGKDSFRNSLFSHTLFFKDISPISKKAKRMPLKVSFQTKEGKWLLNQNSEPEFELPINISK